VYNAGSGSAAFTVYPGSSPWLTATPVNGSASAAAAAGVPMAITMDMSALPAGHYRDSLVVRPAAPDVWNYSWAFHRQMRVFDHRITLLPFFTSLGRVAVSPAGDLVMARNTRNPELVKVDKTTGIGPVWATGVANVNGMQFGPDSALYLALGTGSEGRVGRVDRAGGTLTTLFTTTPFVRDVAVLPDGTIFAAVGGNLLRRGRDGAVTTALSTSRVDFTWSLAYNPADGWLYYFDNAALRRYNPATGVDELRGTVPTLANAPITELAVGRSGRLYGTEYHGLTGAVVVVDTSAALIERIWQPGVGFGLAMDEGKLFGTALNPRETLWWHPVSDGPPGTAVLRGDPNKDGAITAQDALGVLADVVGKPLPAGWNVARGGDADCDGQITALDALIILSKVVGKDVSQFCIGTTN
jgi:hypothetical protein